MDSRQIDRQRVKNIQGLHLYLKEEEKIPLFFKLRKVCRKFYLRTLMDTFNFKKNIFLDTLNFSEPWCLAVTHHAAGEDLLVGIALIHRTPVHRVTKLCNIWLHREILYELPRRVGFE